MSVFRFLCFLTFSLLATGTAMAVSDAALTYFSQAEKAIERGDLATAKEKIQAGLRIEPDHANAMVNLGNVYLLENDFKRAAGWYEKSVKIDPTNASALNGRAVCYMNAGDVPKAVEHWLRATEADPRNPTPIVNLGDAAKLVGDYASAKRYYLLSLDVDPTLERSTLQLAEIAADEGDGDKAIAYAMTVVKRNQASWPARAALGKGYAAKKDWYKAIDSLDPAAKAMPRNVSVLYALGVALMNTGQWAPAAESFLDALEVEKGAGDPKLHLQLGVCYYMVGRPDTLELARTEFLHTLERTPSTPEKVDALYHLALLLDDAGTQAEAVAAYRRVLAIDPGHVASNNNLGLLAMKREKFGDAIPYFQRALTSQPDFAASQLNLGYCLIRSGKKTEGESQLQKLVARLPEGNPLREEARAVLAGKR